MSLVSSASPWINEDTNLKKRSPSIRKTVKLRPFVKDIGEPDEYVSQTEKYQNMKPATIEDSENEHALRNNRVHDMLNKITSVNAENDGNKLADFTPPPNPQNYMKKDIQLMQNEDEPIDSPQNEMQIPVPMIPNMRGNQYSSNNMSLANYSNYQNSYDPTNIINKPYYSKMGLGNGSGSISGNESKLLEKINYMIHLLENQENEKTNNITEEFILYTCLGVFMIFIVDSFARAGKYVR